VYRLWLLYAGDADVVSAQDCTLTYGPCVNGHWTYTYDEFNRLATARTTIPIDPTVATPTLRPVWQSLAPETHQRHGLQRTVEL